MSNSFGLGGKPPSQPRGRKNFKESKVQFESMRMKTTKEVEETSNSKGKLTVLKCDKKSKEERTKSEEQHTNEREY